MKARTLPLLITAAALAFASTSNAKSISRIIAEMGLSPQDFEVVNVASNELLSTGSLSVGQEQSWANAETGSKGTIRVRDIQNNCVMLQHFIQPEGADATREIRTRRCRDASGNWVLTP